MSITCFWKQLAGGGWELGTVSLLCTFKAGAGSSGEKRRDWGHPRRCSLTCPEAEPCWILLEKFLQEELLW